MKVNVWIALRDDAQAAIKTRMDWDEESQGEYSGPVANRTARLFEKMYDRAVVQNLFRVATIGARDYTLWSVYFDESVDILQKVQAELDDLAAEYPSQFIIAGAWKEDGAMVGCDLVLNQVANPAYTGEPYMIANPAYQPDMGDPAGDPYPVDDWDPRTEIRNPAWVPEFITERTQSGTPTYPLHPQLLELMPDVDDIGTRPTEVSDINLLAGQPTRVFA